MASYRRGIVTPLWNHHRVMKEIGDTAGNISGGIITPMWNHHRVMKESGDTGGNISERNCNFAVESPQSHEGE